MKRISIYLLSFFLWQSCFLITLSAQELDFATGIQAYFTFHQEQLQSQNKLVPNVVLSGTEWATNRFGDEASALSFDGQRQSARIPSHPRLDLDQGDEYSLSLWIKPRDSNQGCLILKEGDYGLKWNGLKKPITVFDGLEGGFPEGSFKDWSSSQWYHLLLVKDRSSLKLYINGKLDKEWGVSPKEIPQGKGVFIGKHPYFWGGFTGLIDDIVLYDRPLNKYEAISMNQIENIPVESFRKHTRGVLCGGSRV